MYFHICVIVIAQEERIKNNGFCFVLFFSFWNYCSYFVVLLEMDSVFFCDTLQFILKNTLNPYLNGSE